MSDQEIPGSILKKAILDAGEGEVEGMRVIPLPDETIEVGDWYIGARNTGPHLAVAKKITDGFIVAEEKNVYPFDIHECVKVRLPDLED